MKAIKVLVILVVLVLAASPVLAGACVFLHKDEWVDEDVSVSYDAGNCTLCRVEIFSAAKTFKFTEDGCDKGYCVEGIGTSSGRAWEDSPRHDISHVRWFGECPPTSVVLSEADSVSPISLLALFFGALAFGVAIAVGARRR